MYYVSSKEDRDGCTHNVTLATDIQYDKDGNIDFAVIFDTIYMVLCRHLIVVLGPGSREVLYIIYCQYCCLNL